MKILFLVDGSLKIGMGHIYRSLNLANEIKEKNEIVFITREKLSFKNFKKYYKTFFVEKNNILKEKNIIEKINPDLIIIDKLKERNITINNIKKICENILLIDYTKKNIRNKFHGVTILYPETGFSSQNENNFKYTIINKEFSKNTTTKTEKIAKKIIVLQGGSDTYCFTPKIIDSFNLIKKDLEISVIIGESFNCWKKLEQSISNSNKKIKILHNVKNLSKILKKYDLAITAGGMTSLELACVGIPSIIICGEKFEIETAKLLEKNKCGINLGFGKNISSKQISEYVNNLILNFEQRKQMKKQGQKLIDGNGVIRMEKMIKKLKPSYV